MGYWGAGSFANDDAYDWVYDVAETENLAYVIETLKAITKDDNYLETRECARAIAAAEVVAALKGKGILDLPDEIKTWIKKHPRKVSRKEITIALTAIEKVKMGSELASLWQNSAEAETWFNMINNLEARLSAG